MKSYRLLSAVPHTGDHSNLTLWLIISLATIIVLIAALIIGKKKGIFTRKYIASDDE